MDRSYKLLKLNVLFGSILLALNCFNVNDNHEYPDDFPDHKISISEAIGTYIYIPTASEYKMLNLTKKDTMKLIIKNDSTFQFNIFYYDKLKKVKIFVVNL